MALRECGDGKAFPTITDAISAVIVGDEVVVYPKAAGYVEGNLGSTGPFASYTVRSYDPDIKIPIDSTGVANAFQIPDDVTVRGFVLSGCTGDAIVGRGGPRRMIVEDVEIISPGAYGIDDVDNPSSFHRVKIDTPHQRGINAVVGAVVDLESVYVYNGTHDGIYCPNAGSTATNCGVFFSGTVGGAYGIYVGGAAVNCNAEDNAIGTGIRAGSYTNCNSYTSNAAIYHTAGNFFGGFPGAPCQEAASLFVGGGDYHLKTISPLFSAGDNSVLPLLDAERVAFANPPSIGPLAGDSTPPTVTITSGTTATSVTYTLTGTAKDAGTGLAALDYRVNGGAWTPMALASPFSVNVTLPTASTVLDVRATDGAGNTATDSVTVTVPGPTVTITSPTTATTDTYTLTATTTTVAPLASILSRVNGGPDTAETVAPSLSTSVSLREGRNTIYVQVTDSLGSVGSGTIAVVYTVRPAWLPTASTLLGLVPTSLRLDT